MKQKTATFVSTTFASSLSAQPWKNGAGTTKQIAIFPPEAQWEKNNYLWRLSTAEVHAASAFSQFPGLTRLLTIVKGEELELRMQGGKKLLKPGEVFCFSGDDPIEADVPKGPVQDLGLIYDADQVLAKMSVLRVENRPRAFTLSAPTVLFFMVSGDLGITIYPGELEYVLTPGDSLRVDPLMDERLVHLDPGKGSAVIAAIELAEIEMRTA